MTAELEPTLVRLRQTWMSGGTLPDDLPAEWKALAQEDDTPAIVCLALAGQAIEICFAPVPPTGLKHASPLPELSMPNVPEDARSAFRRALAALKDCNIDTVFLIRMIAERGYVSHPADWMPSKSTDVPHVYSSWMNWLETASSGHSDDDILTSDNWSQWTPAERRHRLMVLRQTDPASVRMLLEAHIGAETADHRATLVELLSTRLSDEDSAFLKSLESDRSGKVKATAARLLARLGERQGNTEDAKELADFLEFRTKGLLTKRKELTFPALKTNAQRNRRNELFDIVALSDLASVSGTAEIDLIHAFKAGPDPLGTSGFVSMVARTGSDECVRIVCDVLVSEPDCPVEAFQALLLRIPDDERRPYLVSLLRRKESALDQTMFCAGTHLGRFSNHEVSASGAIREIEAWARGLNAEKTDRRTENQMVQMLAHLGLLADQEAAKRLVLRFTDCGIPVTDACLNVLRFNAMLERPDTDV